MDSMRSLNTSLPTSLSGSRQNDPPEQLLQAFRSAALSVTTLYKTAALEQSRARQLGYQEALEDLLTFLNTENIEISSGDGFRVKQWATERLDQGDTGLPASSHGDSEDEKIDGERGRSSSPAANCEVDGDGTTEMSQESTLSVPAGPVPQSTIEDNGSALPSLSPAMFTFRSSLPLPSQRDKNMINHELGSPSIAQSQNSSSNPSSQATNAPAFVPRVGAVSRSSRYKHGGAGSRLNLRSLNSLGTLGAGAGYKRKTPFGEFFDINSGGSSRDTSGGSVKRSRYPREPSA